MPFAFTWRPYLSYHKVSRAQVMSPELRLRYVYILVAAAVIGCTQKTNAFAHDLQNAAAQFNTFPLRLGLADHHRECLLLQAVRVGNVQSFGDTAQFGKRFVLKF